MLIWNKLLLPPPALLRYNWYVTLHVFKVYKVMIWIDFINNLEKFCIKMFLECFCYLVLCATEFVTFPYQLLHSRLSSNLSHLEIISNLKPHRFHIFHRPQIVCVLLEFSPEWADFVSSANKACLNSSLYQVLQTTDSSKNRLLSSDGIACKWAELGFSDPLRLRSRWLFWVSQPKI